MNNLPIGRPTKTELLETLRDFGAYKCIDLATNKVTYLIAPTPDAKDWHDYRPTSAVRPFETAEKAIEMLQRWASDPAFPSLPRKLQPPGGRRNGNKPKHTDSPGQLFLDLSP
jgi:hypothetical protein